jgi:hypothetical protein
MANPLEASKCISCSEKKNQPEAVPAVPAVSATGSRRRILPRGLHDMLIKLRHQHKAVLSSVPAQAPGSGSGTGPGPTPMPIFGAAKPKGPRSDSWSDSGSDSGDDSSADGEDNEDNEDEEEEENVVENVIPKFNSPPNPKIAKLRVDFEVFLNSLTTERITAGVAVEGFSVPAEDSAEDPPPPPGKAGLTRSKSLRSQSLAFHQTMAYSAVKDLHSLLTFKDKAGNTAAHHLAFLRLDKALAALERVGASLWEVNQANVSANAVFDGEHRIVTYTHIYTHYIYIIYIIYGSVPVNICIYT